MLKYLEFFENIASATGVNPEDDSVFYVIYENEDNSDENYLEFSEDLSYCMIVKDNEIVKQLNINCIDDLIEEIETSNEILQEILNYSQKRLERMKDLKI